MIAEFTLYQLILIALIFVWTGFVRSGLGFGGAALGLPFMLYLNNQPIYWLPIIGTHLLFFSSLTISTQLRQVDWRYLSRSALWIIPAALVGVFGLLNLPNRWLLNFIYAVTLIYGGIWIFNLAIKSNTVWLDKIFLVLGGYIAGTSLTGAPLMVAVFARNVTKEKLRNTLFVLWFVLVAIKMSTFAILGVDLQLATALLLLPLGAVGHVVGLRFHQRILQNDLLFKRMLGVVLVVVSGIGLWNLS
ncbi:MAG: TSUP family transporter [Gammaproteobacteria bacterium]|nr:TSUP family transporter [Gammaproteobacteria bacterium]